MNNDDFQDYLLKDYLDDDGNLSFLLNDMKEWARKIPPILGGTIASIVLSNPTFIGVGGILLILQELGIDVVNLIKINKNNNIDIPKLNQITNYANKKNGYTSNKACLDRILYEIDMTLMIYEIELSMDEKELKIILNKIMKMVNEKKYENLKYDILCYYYKRVIANVINSDDKTIDYYDFMNGLNYLKDIKGFNKVDISRLVKDIVRELNLNYKEEDKIKIINFNNK